MARSDSTHYNSELHCVYDAASRVTNVGSAWGVLKKGAQLFDEMARGRRGCSIQKYLYPALTELTKIYDQYRGKLNEQQRKRFERAHKRIRDVLREDGDMPILMPAIVARPKKLNGVRRYVF